MRYLAGLFVASIAAAQTALLPSVNLSCVGTPGNTVAAVGQQCQDTTGIVYACKNSAGCAAAADWATSSATSGITALTGDGTATGPGSAALTLSTVNSNVGAFGSTTVTAGTAPSMPYFTTTAKGLLTAAGAVSLGNAASYSVGTSGATIPLNNGANVFSGSLAVGGSSPSTNLTLIGTTATDSAPLGAELTTSGTTTSGGWTGTYNSYANNTSNTSPLTYAPTIASGSSYQIVITVSGYSAGSVSITFGGLSLSGMSSNSTQTIGPKATSTAGLVITPTSAFVGTVTASIKLISPITNFAINAEDSTGATSFSCLQQRASLHNLFCGGGGSSNTTGNSNSAQGYQALYSNTTGYSNSAQGTQALYSNTTGGNNSAQGTQALYSNTTGGNNSAQGYYALYSNTTGNSNSAQGYQALYSNTTGYSNSAQGYQALYSNTTGYSNSAQGTQALYSNTTGGNNSAQGTQALYSNTTGYSNSAQGYQALYSNTTGYSNSAQGYQALYSNTTGYNNSAQGTQALYSNTTGGNNSAQGYQAGYGTSATNANTTGSYNSFFGVQAAPGSTTQQSYMTVIGAGATGTCSSCVVLGRSTDTTYAAAIGGTGSAPTITNTTGSMAISTSPPNSGATQTAGELVSSTTGTVTFTMTFGVAALHRWDCTFRDESTITDIVGSTQATAPTTTALTVTGTTASGDIVSYVCVNH